MTGPTKAACRRPRDVACVVPCTSRWPREPAVYILGPRDAHRWRPCCHPRDEEALIMGPPALPALHVAKEAFSERYSEGHPLVRPLTPTWRPVAR